MVRIRAIGDDRDMTTHTDSMTPDLFDRILAETTHGGEVYGYDRKTPRDIIAAAREFAVTFNVRGECDPPYLCNVIAREMHRGNGFGNFNGIDPDDYYVTGPRRFDPSTPADRLGLCWENGKTKFRHGPVDLKVADATAISMARAAAPPLRT